MIGQHIFFNCHNRYAHNQTLWLLEGREDIFATKFAKRVSLHNKGRTLRFGPIQKDDDRVSINCEVVTSVGTLPSPLGMIYVQSKERERDLHLVYHFSYCKGRILLPPSLQLLKIQMWHFICVNNSALKATNFKCVDS